MKIDAHHHLWQYSEEQYPWITDALGILRRDFLPNLLKSEITLTGIDGTILVQARQDLEETDWLVKQAEAHSWILAVVGWLPLADAKVGKLIERYAESPMFRGVRHVLQDEAKDEYMLGKAFNRGVGLLKDHNLVYDILIFERHLANTIKFVDRHPEQTFVLDHVAKPVIREKLMEPWDELIRQLAERENVYCKLSGMVTEANWKIWTEAEMRPYVDTVLEAFGPHRLMFGSDWPVCLLASEYERWYRLVMKLIKELSPVEQDRIMGETAMEAYGLG